MTSSLTDSSLWRFTTATGIKARLVERSGNFSEEEAQMQEVYILKSDTLMDFIDESFPAPIIYLAGLLYPTRRRAPGFDAMKSVRVSWEAFTPGLPVDPFGIDPTAPAGTYKDEIKVTVDYSTSFDNDAAPDPNNPLTFLEISADAGGKFPSARIGGTSKWEGVGGEPDVENRHAENRFTLAEPLVEWTIKWSQVPFGFFNGTLASRLRQNMGKVNSLPMTLMFNAPAETVLFMAWSARQQFTWRPGLSGQSPMEIELKFHEFNFIWKDGVQVTHNHQFRSYGSDAITGPPAVAATYPGYRRVLYTTGAGTFPPYESVNLNSIFLP